MNAQLKKYRDQRDEYDSYINDTPLGEKPSPFYVNQRDNAFAKITLLHDLMEKLATINDLFD